MSTGYIPPVVATAIAIRNKFGYGTQLRDYFLMLSEFEQQVVKKWFTPDPEVVEASRWEFISRIEDDPKP